MHAFGRALAFVVVAAVAVVAGRARAEPCVTPVRVQGHGVPAAVVDDLAAAAPALEATVQSALGLSSCAPVHVDLLPAIEGADALEPPWHLPEWAAGAADPGERRIVVAITARGERQDRERILLHELAHVGVREAANGRPVPHWLDEGSARTIANENAGDLDALARARIGDRLVPLAAFAEGFPIRGDIAALAYAESARAVGIIDAVPGGLARTLAAIGDGMTLDDALEQGCGRRVWQLDLDVERSIPLVRAWSIIGMQSDLAYALAALACAWAGIRARRRIRYRIAHLDDVPSPAAWLLSAAEVAIARFNVAR